MHQIAETRIAALLHLWGRLDCVQTKDHARAHRSIEMVMDEMVRSRGDSSGKGQGRHVSKIARRNKNIEIKFDPSALREYVTGFRKRKQQRRVKAQKQIERKEKERIVEERAKKRQAIKDLIKDAGLDSNSEDEDSGSSGGEEPMHNEKDYESRDARVTVTVQKMGDSSSSEGDAEEEGGEDHAETSGFSKKTEWAKQKGETRSRNMSSGGGSTRKRQKSLHQVRKGGRKGGQSSELKRKGHGKSKKRSNKR